MAKITKRTVETAAPRDKEYYIWDEDIPGLGLRVLPSGRRQYIVQYRAGRRSRRMSLGPSTVLTTEQARSRALAILADARSGKDPAADREARRDALLVKDLAERFDQQHISLRIKASTAKGYRRSLAKFILPKLGQMVITDVTRADVAKFHHDLRHIPYEANRCLEIISKMFNLAELWGLRPDGSNPRRLIQKYPEVKRERFLARKAEKQRRADEKQKRREEGYRREYILNRRREGVAEILKEAGDLELMGTRLAALKQFLKGSQRGSRVTQLVEWAGQDLARRRKSISAEKLESRLAEKQLFGLDDGRSFKPYQYRRDAFDFEWDEDW